MYAHKMSKNRVTFGTEKVENHAMCKSKEERTSFYLCYTLHTFTHVLWDEKSFKLLSNLLHVAYQVFQAHKYPLDYI